MMHEIGWMLYGAVCFKFGEWLGTRTFDKLFRNRTHVPNSHNRT